MPRQIISTVLILLLITVSGFAQTAKRKRRNVKKKQPTVNQPMTNSPGGIQAGRDVIINQERKLTEEQRKQFLVMVRSSAWERGGLVAIESPIGDSEAARFAEQLSGLLKEAGWTTAVSQAGGYLQVPIGLTISVHENEVPSSASLLQFALGQIGFKSQGYSGDREVRPGNIRLIVGARP